MNNKKSKIVLEDQQNEFFYLKNKSNLDLSFNRISFIFFIFFLISLIFSIHLIHLGSRKAKTQISNFQLLENNIYRADIVRNG